MQHVKQEVIHITRHLMELFFDFMGKCEYVLAKDSVNNLFEIRQKNEPCNRIATCTQSVTIMFPTINITLNRGSILINGSVGDFGNYGG